MRDHRNTLTRFLEHLWYRQHLAWYGFLLLPVSWLFKCIAAKRRASQTRSAVRLPVPVIVVGNISIGGSGKTPVIQALAAQLASRGYKPGIISRGYGAKNTAYPARVPYQADPTLYGDEPTLLAHSTGCPVIIDPDRVRAAKHLLASTDCDVILSDDGLQHYRLARDIEIIVLDGARGLGNGHCLPAGPLREPASRLDETAFLLCNGQAIEGVAAAVMPLKPVQWRQVATEKVYAVDDYLPFPRAHAVAGIGNPHRFFDTLTALGLQIERHAFADHHQFVASDFELGDDLPVVMTAKDAIKCDRLDDQRLWVLDVEARLPDDFLQALLHRLKELS